MILCSCDYVTWYLLIQDISCSLYSCHSMHACSYYTWSIVLIIHVVVIAFISLYWQTYFSYYFNALLVLLLHFCILFLLLFSLHVHLLVRFWQTLYYFSVSRSKSWYRREDRRMYYSSGVTPVSLVFVLDLYYSEWMVLLMI